MTTQTLQLALSSLDTTPFRNLSESHILDRNLLTQTLHDAENALRSCEVNIAKQLAEREELIRSIKRCKSLLSYIHTMPPEILLSIFAYLCERNELDPRIIPPAMAISFVCSRWRHILLSTDGQRLWSSFRVYFDEWDAKPISLAHVVQSYVDRSGTKPLKVELVWNHYCTERNVIDPTLRILVDNSTRWSEMDFRCGSETKCSPDYAITRRIRGRLPLLQHLQWSDSCPDDLFQDAPALSSVVCRDINSVPRLPFEHLTHLNVIYMREVFVKHMLSRCQRLQHLIVTQIMRDDSADNSGIEVSKVNHLTVIAKDEAGFRFSLDRLLLPKLKHLELIGTSSDTIPSTRALRIDIGLLQRSRNITILRLEKLPISDTQLICAIPYLSNLQQLYIHDFGTKRTPREYRSNRTVTSNLFKSLAHVDGNSIPKLSELTLKVHSKQFDAKGLVKLVSSRCARGGMISGCLQLVEVELLGNAQTRLPGEFSSLYSFKDSVGLQITTFVTRSPK